MELFFCDLCQEAVPQSDVDGGRALVRGSRVVCHRCNDAMGGVEDQAAGSTTTEGASSGTTDARSQPTPRPGRPLISSGLGAVLGLAAILLTLVAVVALLFRIEILSRQARSLHDANEERISDLEERTVGTRDGMIARARTAAEDAVYAELQRLETLERQLAELRTALGGGAAPASAGDAEGETPEAPGSDLDSASLLTLGDAVEKVELLEEQILFLQARVFELLEGGALVEGEAEPQPKLVLPDGEVGDWIAQLAHQDPIERVGALYALAQVQDGGVVRHLVPLLEDGDAYIRSLTARILEKRDARSAVQALIERLGDTDVGVRSSAVSALRSITGQQFRFDPSGRGGDRFAAVRRWKDWWADNWNAFLYGED